MKYKVVWTERAIDGFSDVLDYLEENWTKKEIDGFWKVLDHFFDLLSAFPEILAPSRKHKHLHRGPVNKHTIITYLVKPKQGEIVLINFRAAKQTMD